MITIFITIVAFMASIIFFFDLRYKKALKIERKKEDEADRLWETKTYEKLEAVARRTDASFRWLHIREPVLRSMHDFELDKAWVEQGSIFFIGKILNISTPNPKHRMIEIEDTSVRGFDTTNSVFRLEVNVENELFDLSLIHI